MNFPYKRLMNGKVFNILEPDGSILDIEYIAYSLSGINRYGGDAFPFYSVAQHSINCMWYAERYYPGDHKLAISCLLHDSAESIISDAVSTFKQYLYFYNPKTDEFISFSDIEERINIEVGLHLGHDIEYGVYKEADLSVRMAEAPILVGREMDETDCEFDLRPVPKECSFLPWDRQMLIDTYIHHFRRLDKIIKKKYAKTESV